MIDSYHDNANMRPDCKSNVIPLVFQSTGGTFCSIFPACLALTSTPRDLTTEMPNSGILHALPNLAMLFSCLAFPKVTFACSFGAFDVNVSVFNTSFSGADVRGLGLIRAAEGADRHRRSILSRPPCDLFLPVTPSLIAQG